MRMQNAKCQTPLCLLQGGIYNLPSHLSPGARDLIPRMLLVDPLKRITIPEIRCVFLRLQTDVPEVLHMASLPTCPARCSQCLGLNVTMQLCCCCRQHPWFTVHLPRYLAVMQADTVASASTIDEEIVTEVRLSCDSHLISQAPLHCDFEHANWTLADTC